MIREQYVSFETAKLLKEKGFDEPTQKYCEVSEYPSDTTRENFKRITGRNMETVEIHSLFGLEDEPFFNSIEGKDENKFAYPTQSLVMHWLREVHKIDIVIFHEQLSGDLYWARISKYPYTEYEQKPIYSTYEEACEAAIKYCLENLI